LPIIDLLKKKITVQEIIRIRREENTEEHMMNVLKRAASRGVIESLKEKN
jgi:hypothetical protein